MSRAANPFATTDLYVADEVHGVITDNVHRNDARRPFRRQIDAWWLALLIGLQNGEHRPLTGKTVKFMDGTIFGSDPWRITHLELLGLSWFGPEGLDRPHDIVSRASEYANAGFDWVVETVAGQTNRTLALYSRLGELVGDATH